MLDSGQVKTFCDAAAGLLPKLAEFAGATERKPEEVSLARQLMVAASALNNALIEVSRTIPPPMPPMPAPPPTPTNQGS
jgi:hypothetical protein